MYGGHKIARFRSPLFCALGKHGAGAAGPVVILLCLKQQKALESLNYKAFCVGIDLFFQSVAGYCFNTPLSHY